MLFNLFILMVFVLYFTKLSLLVDIPEIASAILCKGLGLTSIIGLAAVNDNSRSVLHLSRGRTGLGRGGPGAPPLPPAGPSTAGGPGYTGQLLDQRNPSATWRATSPSNRMRNSSSLDSPTNSWRRTSWSSSLFSHYHHWPESQKVW